jgi:hypothetical protein
MAITRILGATAISPTIPASAGGTGTTSFAPGKILQVVSTAYPNAGQTTITATSYTFIPGYNVEITPSSTSSKIYVTGSAHFDSGGNGNEIGLAIYRYKDGSYTNPISYASDYGQTSDSSRENKTVPAWPYIDSPNTTQTLYYAFYAKTSSGDTIYLNRKTCNITVMEIGA